MGNFLDRIINPIKETASNLYYKATNALGDLFGGSSQNSAMVFPQMADKDTFIPGTIPDTQVMSKTVPMTVAPNASTSAGPAKILPSGQAVYNTPQGAGTGSALGIDLKNNQSKYVPATTVNPAKRATPPTQPTPSQPTPQNPSSPYFSYMDAPATQRKPLPPPPQAASGQSGASYVDSQGNFVSGGGGYVTPPQGGSGTGGRSTAVNSIGGANLGGPSTLTSISTNPEDEQRNKAIKLINSNTATPKPFTAPLPGEAFDMQSLIKQGSDIVARSKAGTLDATTKQQFIDTATKAIDQATVKLNEMKAIPEEPMLNKDMLVEDPAQKEQLTNTPIQEYENIQRKLGIPDLIKKYETNLSQVQAATETFNSIIKDIKDNPNMPKGLALARMREAEGVAGNTIRALQGQAEVLRTQLEFKKDELKERLGISERARATALTQQNQLRDDARAQLQMFVITGSLGSLSPQDLLSLSKATGYTPDSIGKMAAAVKSGNESKIAKAQADLAKVQAQIAKEEAARLKKDPGTIFDQKQSEIPKTEQALIASRKGGEYVDGNVYNDLRRKSKLSPSEFDERFGNLLSQGDQAKFNVQAISKKTLDGEQLSIINDAKERIDFIRSQLGDTETARQQIIQYSIQNYGFDPSPYL